MPKRVHWEVTSKSGYLFVRRDTRDEALEQMDPSRVGRVVKVTRYSARESAARRAVIEAAYEVGYELGYSTTVPMDLRYKLNAALCALDEFERIESEAKK